MLHNIPTCLTNNISCLLAQSKLRSWKQHVSKSGIYTSPAVSCPTHVTRATCVSNTRVSKLCIWYIAVQNFPANCMAAFYASNISSDFTRDRIRYVNNIHSFVHIQNVLFFFSVVAFFHYVAWSRGCGQNTMGIWQRKLIMTISGLVFDRQDWTGWIWNWRG